MQEWSRDKSVSSVIVRAVGTKAFCAGGDIKSVVEDARVGGEGGRIGRGTLSDAFFREEYALDLASSRVRVPYVALVDGFVIGGVCSLLFSVSPLCTAHSLSLSVFTIKEFDLHYCVYHLLLVIHILPYKYLLVQHIERFWMEKWDY